MSVPAFKLEDLARPIKVEEIHSVDPPTFKTKEEAQQFAEWVISFRDRPWDWVLACYPWGERGTDLERRYPETWQRNVLMDLQERLTNGLSPEQALNTVIKVSVATGHGVGKTALVAWIIHWFISTHVRPQIVVTASTENQLDTKTWRELRKWQKHAINGWMFEWTATRYRHRDDGELWFAAKVPWSEANSQAFAGTHEKYVMFVFDEASGIAPKIWEVAEGGLTSGRCLFFAFGNPTESSGGFHDSHHRFRHRWKTYTVDSRTVTFTNRQQLTEWIEDHGEDSDFVRVRVRGMFPHQAFSQFISPVDVAEAVKRKIEWKDVPRTVPRVMGVDVARQGDDSSVIVLRVGRKMHPTIIRLNVRDLMAVASRVMTAIRDFAPDVIFVDATGMGSGVYDRLVQMGVQNVVEVHSGSKPDDPSEKKVYANMRIVMWARMRDWLKGADIPDDPMLQSDILAPTYTYQRTTQLELLESKEDMKARGVPSPDAADALALTFFQKVPSRLAGTRSAEPDAV